MKREIDRLTGEIEMDKKTYNYRFAEAESKQQKDQIVRSFMRQLFGLEIPQNNAWLLEHRMLYFIGKQGGLNGRNKRREEAIC